MANVSFAMAMKASPNSPPSDATLLMTSLLPAASDAEKVTSAAVEEAAPLVLLSRPFRKAKAK